jgi:xylulokinase
MMWLRQHAPEAFARTRLWLNVADFIAYRLCGVAATDFSLASRTLWLDLHKRAWSDEIMTGSNTPPTLLAPLLPSGARLGAVLPEVASATGLPLSTQVAVGGHDHVCGALALGVTTPGDVMNSIGTAEALFVPLAQALTDPQVGRQGYSQGVHTGTNYYIFGGLYTSGACIEWFREHLADSADYTPLTAEAATVPAGSLGVHFLPHLRLANPPRVDPLARGAFIGLRGDVGRGALFRAVLEGLAYEFRNSLEPLLQHAGLGDVNKIYATGGGAYNELALRIKASILDRPLRVISVKETTALGAAILGGLGAGVYTDLAAALDQIQYTHTTVTPDEHETAFYGSAFRQIYRPLYQTLRPLHHTIGTIVR